MAAIVRLTNYYVKLRQIDAFMPLSVLVVAVPAGAEGGHLGLGPEPVSDFEGQLLPGLLVGERGQVVEAEQRVGERGLSHALLAQHHEPRAGELAGLVQVCRERRGQFRTAAISTFTPQGTLMRVLD